MKLIRHLHTINHLLRGGVVTVGNFDGLHRGHQSLIHNLRAHADRNALPLTVIIFEPQPQEYYRGAKAPARLLSLSQKIEGLTQWGVDQLVCLRFDQTFSQLSAQQFIENILVDRLAVSHIGVGDDFRFGYQRQGDINTLKQAAVRYAFDVSVVEPVYHKEVRISSTHIREALVQADFTWVQQLLNRPYTWSGCVVHGKKLGRQLGFPTLNLRARRQVVPLQGVYAVQVHGLDSRTYQGAAYIGYRKAITPLHQSEAWLEVHMLDVSQNAYGRHIKVEFLHKISEALHFNTFEQLRDKIAQDIQSTRSYFENIQRHKDASLSN